MDRLRTYGIDAFARSLHHELTEGDSKYAFFLGAGCSITSGIPAAAELVRRQWLPKLVKIRTGDEKRAEDWAKQNIKDFDPNNPAASYSKVMEERFNSAQKRQEEIERITRDGKPGYGYSALARLLAHQDYGRRCNVVLTTNFDDLVADALYLFGGERGRPLVIGHEALMSFVRVTRTAPMVVKLHHDRHLAPKNTEAEIDQLAEHVRHALHNVLQERGLIFMGYGGADPSIVKALKELKGGLPYGVYWINDGEPQADLRAWLMERDAIWVKHRDFDQAMFMIAREFGLDQPQRPASFDAIFDNNEKKYEELWRAAGLNRDPEQAPLRQAAQEAGSKVSNAFAMLVTAYRLEETDPDAADKAYLEGIRQHPTDADLIGMYARFLYLIRKDPDGAEAFYKRAIDANPKHANNLGNYAWFLHDIRKDHERAEAFFKHAIDADPKHANNLGNYAWFLKNVRKDHDGAEAFYQRAIDADPKHANNLGNYALFLKNVRKDYDGAEAYYKRAVDADPKRVDFLGNYAWFLENVRKDYEGAEAFYNRAIDADPKHANNLGNYAWFLENVRKDYDGAEAFYKRAIAADPKHANTLGNYAGFLFGLGRDGEGLGMLESCEAENPEPALLLECRFYRLCRAATTDAERAELLRLTKQAIKEDVHSPGFDLSANVERARIDNVPGVDMLAVLAKVIADEEPAETLNQFPEWVAAG